MTPPRSATAIAAAAAGAPILVSFFVWHWYNIAPTWGVLIEAAVAYPLGILGIAWAWRVARRRGAFAARWGGVAFGAVFVSGLLLAEGIGLLRGRLPTPDSGAAIMAEIGLAALALVPVTLIGWRVARGRGAAAFALAGLPLDLHLGGTVMHLGGRGPDMLLFLVLVATYLLAGVILPRVESRLAPQAWDPASVGGLEPEAGR